MGGDVCLECVYGWMVRACVRACARARGGRVRARLRVVRRGGGGVLRRVLWGCGGVWRRVVAECGGVCVCGGVDVAACGCV